MTNFPVNISRRYIVFGIAAARRLLPAAVCSSGSTRSSLDQPAAGSLVLVAAQHWRQPTTGRCWPLLAAACLPLLYFPSIALMMFNRAIVLPGSALRSTTNRQQPRQQYLPGTTAITGSASAAASDFHSYNHGNRSSRTSAAAVAQPQRPQAKPLRSTTRRRPVAAECPAATVRRRNWTQLPSSRPRARLAARRCPPLRRCHERPRARTLLAEAIANPSTLVGGPQRCRARTVLFSTVLLVFVVLDSTVLLVFVVLDSSLQPSAIFLTYQRPFMISAMPPT